MARSGVIFEDRYSPRREDQERWPRNRAAPRSGVTAEDFIAPNAQWKRSMRFPQGAKTGLRSKFFRSEPLVTLRSSWQRTYA